MAKTISKMQKKGAKDWVKVIVSEISPKSGKYTFKERIIPKDMVKEYVKK
ncbi:MAG: DUF4295 family protein [Bacteroidia bacterium]